MQYYEKIKNAVREADRVLVGLGEEWVLTDEAIYNAVEDSHPVFTALLKFAATQEQYRDIVPYLEAFYYNQITEIPDMWKDAYAHLRRLLEGKDYYIVKADVYYDYTYSLIVDGAATSSYHDMVSYTVFSQKFYTKQAPEIYFEYQPYCISGANTENAVYQSDDYICLLYTSPSPRDS